MSGFEGATAIVTGGTSGIGAATALALAAEGASVVVSGRNQAAADGVVDEITSSGGRALAALGDVADSSFADALVASAVREFGRLDIVVNGAGIIVREDAAGTSDEQWSRQMAVNVDGTFFVSRAAVRHWREAGGSESEPGRSIVNVASNVGLVGTPGLAGYCASKGAVVMLTKAMAIDHAAEGIRINCVCPGGVDTPMLRSGREARPMTDEEIIDMNVASIPQGRVATPEEVAQVIAFLCTPAAAHLIGTALPIDGGYVAQ